MAGFKNDGVAINALGVCKTAACFKFSVTLKAFRGVESAVTVVESPVFAWFKFGLTLKAFRGVERAVIVVESPVLVDKLTSGRLVFISSGRIPCGSSVFVFSCCLKVRYLFCN